MKLRVAAGLLAAVTVVGLSGGVAAARGRTASSPVHPDITVTVGTLFEIVTYAPGANGGAKCANVAGGSTRPGALLITWRCVSSSNELFDFVPSSNDGTNQYYQIRNQNSHLCFELPNESGADGTPIEQASCAIPYDTEQFRVQIFRTGTIDDGADISALVSKRFPSMCLTRQGPELVANDNDKMVLSTCAFHEPQLWYLA